MKTQIQNHARILIVVAIVALTLNVTLADDLNAPTYRGDPLSVHAHWKIDLTGTNNLVLDTFSFVDDTDPSTTLDPLLPSNPVNPTSDPTGVNKNYQFDLPNWVDKLPVKKMRLQLTWQFSTTPPAIVGLSGIDSSGPVTINPIFTSLVTPGTDPTTLYQYHDFELYPNPDAERWIVQIPDNAQLIQVVADTVSTVPEPATLLLLGLGGLLFRKKRNV